MYKNKSVGKILKKIFLSLFIFAFYISITQIFGILKTHAATDPKTCPQANQRILCTGPSDCDIKAHPECNGLFQCIQPPDDPQARFKQCLYPLSAGSSCSGNFQTGGISCGPGTQCVNNVCVTLPPTPAGSGSTVNNPCPSNICNTALGPINVSSGADFVRALFQVLLSLAGGIALLMIIISGYNMAMSQGNPEKIKGAQETLTAAIIGLLFIILSVVILQIIGVDILKIPGFTK